MPTGEGGGGMGANAGKLQNRKKGSPFQPVKRSGGFYEMAMSLPATKAAQAKKKPAVRRAPKTMQKQTKRPDMVGRATTNFQGGNRSSMINNQGQMAVGGVQAARYQSLKIKKPGRYGPSMG